jgi:hypothetical protein
MGPRAAGYSQGKLATDDHSGVKGFELSRLHDERTYPTTVAKKGDASGRHQNCSERLRCQVTNPRKDNTHTGCRQEGYMYSKSRTSRLYIDWRSTAASCLVEVWEALAGQHSLGDDARERELHTAHIKRTRSATIDTPQSSPKAPRQTPQDP